MPQAGSTDVNLIYDLMDPFQVGNDGTGHLFEVIGGNPATEKENTIVILARNVPEGQVGTMAQPTFCRFLHVETLTGPGMVQAS